MRDKEGMSPCMWACRMDHIEHFELLSGVENPEVEEEDGFERDLSGKTWMHWSVRRTEPLECLKVGKCNGTENKAKNEICLKTSFFLFAAKSYDINATFFSLSKQ